MDACGKDYQWSFNIHSPCLLQEETLRFSTGHTPYNTASSPASCVDRWSHVTKFLSIRYEIKWSVQHPFYVDVSIVLLGRCTRWLDHEKGHTRCQIQMPEETAGSNTDPSRLQMAWQIHHAIPDLYVTAKRISLD